MEYCAYSAKIQFSNIVCSSQWRIRFFKYADVFTLQEGLLTDTDLYTNSVYPLEIGNSITTPIAPHQVNLNRDWYNNEQHPTYSLSLLPEDPIYTRAWSVSEKKFLKKIYTAYHKALGTLISKSVHNYGFALLIDCHSLNPKALTNTPDAPGKERAHFIIGSLDDTSADIRIIEKFHQLLTERATPYGWQVIKNDPYKGGHITQTWAKPKGNIHALQLEIRKDLYMNMKNFSKNDTFIITKKLLAEVFDELHHFTTKLYK